MKVFAFSARTGQFRANCRIIRILAAVALRSVVAMVLCLARQRAATAARFWKNSVPSPGSWGNGFNWSATSATGADNAGRPVANDTVNITPTDGANHTVTYDIGTPLTLTQLNVDLTGAVATTATLSMSMPTNNLTSNNEWVGVNGRGTIDQSAGTNTIAAGAGFLDVGVYGPSPGLFGGNGTYNLSGTGALVANTNEYIGDGGTGVFNQTGGSNTINGAGNHFYLGTNAMARAARTRSAQAPSRSTTAMNSLASMFPARSISRAGPIR